MCSEYPKEFQKTTEVLPFTKYGISSIEDFRKAEKDVQHLEWLKKIGLTNEEVKLYQENQSGVLDLRKKIETNVLQSKLDAIYNKINDFQSTSGSSKDVHDIPSTSVAPEEKSTMMFYPEGHPMNNLKKLDEDLFGHHNNDDMLPLTKRRKMLRHMERKKERLLSQQKQPMIPVEAGTSRQPPKPGSLWDVQEMPDKRQDHNQAENIIGPKKPTMYTVKDNEIMRLQPLQRPLHEEDTDEEYQAIDIIPPINPAEEQLLEGTKMCLDDIRKIERFKDYEPGVPSNSLYLRNIAPSVTLDQLSLLFNQFLLDNGGPVDMRLCSGRMQGQAFVIFSYEDLAIQALDEINGTILNGQPIIAQFGRFNRRILMDENR
ncbi:uncharacterized protein [Epargyreus clarus]|uniref:uncharacterized protein n=1 Tax=Epargyreus clarus TaxID=520877 RepID=UPI003C2BA699